MDVLCYYKDQKRVAVFQLPKDQQIRNIGSCTENDYFIPDEEVDAVHLKVRYQNGIYQFLPVAEMIMEDLPLPLNSWLDLTPQKKLWLTEEHNQHLIFLSNVVVKKTLKKTKRLQQQLPTMPKERKAVTERKTRSNLMKQTRPYNMNELQETAVDHFTPAHELKVSQDLPVNDLDSTLFQPTQRKKRTNLNTQEVIDDRYRILKTLGKGGMGIVYKVFDQKLSRIVALKLLLEQENATLEAQQRFQGEARSMAKLRHQYIVRVYDNGIHEGRPYYSMDFVEGNELPESLQGVKIRQAMRWMLKICEAVHYFHQSGIIHRDLKPSNIMISKSSQDPLLMDFGIARDEASMSGLTAAGQSIGTPAYMAPEQAKGMIKQIDERTDVYGLGAILYEILTGKPPFSGAPMQVLFKVCNDEPKAIQEINPQVPRDIIIIAEKAMSKEKSFRYASAQDMAEDIKRYLEGLCIRAQAPSFSVRMIRKFRKNRNLGYLVMTACIVLVLLVGGLVYSRYKAAQNRQKKIAHFLEEANKALEMTKTEEENVVPLYIKASENYTKILGLDSQNIEGKKGKFKALCELAAYAATELNDYHFALTMYNSALQMDVDNNFVNKEIDNLNQMKKEENKQVQDKIDKIFQILAKE